MSLLIPWLVFPLVLGALSLGCGLLVERVSGLRLPGPLVLPTGFAALAVAAQLATATTATARLAVPLVIVLAVIGFGLSFRWRPERRLDPWALGAAIAVLCAYAAPIVLSGQATWAGYIKLDDTATFLALTDRAMDHSRSIGGLLPSTYLRTLDTLLIHGYPLATFMPLGVGHKLLGTDSAWLFQPCLAFMAAMLALSLYELCARAIDLRWLRALVAFIAAQSALLYGYMLWSGIKEVGTAWALPLLVALLPQTLRDKNPRSLIPLATVSALLLGVLNVGAGVWLPPALLFTLVAVFRDRGLQGAIRAAAAFVGFLVVLALPTIVSMHDFVSSNPGNYSALTNLARPLSPLQMAGIWPAGDFRFDPERLAATHLLVAVTIAAAAAGVIWTLRRGAWELPLFVVGSVASALVLWGLSTPWIAGKAFATASPAVPLAALVLCAPLFRSGRLVEGAVLGAVVAGGVLWSNVAQYHDAWLAPRHQLVELERVGSRFAGDGPALMTEYQPAGVRHFLRRLDAEGAAELRFRTVPLLDGQPLEQGHYADIDQFELQGILVYRTLVLRRSPVLSRPPSVYRLVWRRRFYDVWQRPEATPVRIIEHAALGNELDPAAVPSCGEVRRLAGIAGPGGRLAAVARPPVTVIDLANSSHPPSWGAGGGVVVPAGSGTIELTAEVPTRGRYGVWVGGSFRDSLVVRIDGRKVGTMRNELNWPGQYTPFGQVDLGAGTHRFTLRYDGPDVRPGSGGPQFPMGPLILSRPTADLPVVYVATRDADSLCNRNLDWVEAITP